MAKRTSKRKTSSKRKTTSKRKTSGRTKRSGAKKTSRRRKATGATTTRGKKRVVKKVTVRDLATVEEFGGRHRARVARRPLMRDIRLDQKRVTKWQREEMRTL